MKKLIAMIIAAALLLALASCAGTEPESTTEAPSEAATTVPEETTAAEETTEEETTAEEVTTAAEETTTEAEQTTEEETTAEETTAEETTEEETTVEETTAEETTAEVTTAEETTAEETTAEETQPAPADDRYVYEGISVKKPAGYTFKDFFGLPSGLKNGTDEGTCFFNFSTMDPVEPMTEESAVSFLDSSKAILTNFGNYTINSFKSYEVDGVTVTKLDYVWEIGIIQSLVRVHLADKTTVVQFAVLNTIPEGITEFDSMINTLEIVK